MIYAFIQRKDDLNCWLVVETAHPKKRFTERRTGYILARVIAHDFNEIWDDTEDVNTWAQRKWNLSEFRIKEYKSLDRLMKECFVSML